MNDQRLPKALALSQLDVLRSAAEAEVMSHVAAELDDAAEHPDTFNADRVTRDGVTWAESGRTDVDALALTWLRAGALEEDRLVPVIVFLCGFWNPGFHAEPIPSDRVKGLLDAWDQAPEPEEGSRFALLYALSNALRTGITPPGIRHVRERVRAMGERDWSAEATDIVREIVASALDSSEASR